MSGFAFKTNREQDDDAQEYRKPITDTQSKSLMLSGERHDSVELVTVVTKFSDQGVVPEQFSIKQRVDTYFGPKLLLASDGGQEYLLTAPGPDTHLCLWGEKTNERGYRESWVKLAEVKATLSDSQKSYHICPQCSEPLKSAGHEQMAAMGQCPNM